MKLWKHQEESVRRFQRQVEAGYKGIALFHEQGTGKTITALECASSIPDTHRILIITPAITITNWCREIKSHTGLTACPLTGSAKQRADALESSDALYTVCNYESVRIKSLWSLIKSTSWDCIILDESHRIKNPSSQIAKEILSLCSEVPYVLVLSGTPILTSPLDAYTQLKVLEPHDGKLPYSVGYNYYAYRARYFYNNNSSNPFVSFADWRIRPGAEKDIAEIIDNRSYRVLKSECLDLPPVVRQTILVGLTPEIQESYIELEKYFVTNCHGLTVITDLVLTQMLRLLQMLSGIVSNGAETRLVETQKHEALRELLPTLVNNHKVIIWANFVPAISSIQGICNELKIPHGLIAGGQTASERQRAIDSFQNDETIRVLIANQAAGGIGVNLTAASYMIYFSKGYSLEHDLQSEARCHRGGSEIHQKVTRIDLVTEGTIEEKVNEALASKLSMAELLLNIGGR